jgi:hypothetical protein
MAYIYAYVSFIEARESEMFEIWSRSNHQAEWTLYGVFSSEAEFRRELPNIRFLGLYIQRRRAR